MTVADLYRESVSKALVLSLIVSLASVAIVSRNLLTDYVRVILSLAAFAAPMLLGLVFRAQIMRMGPFVYCAALVLAFCAALVFGI